ncbi:MAG: nucleotidyltransferase domain-containing protein [Nitrososphaerales archaeon]|nr:nucleotidyltransferase domain-containing protein [Nitrososphaerales archaeon]
MLEEYNINQTTLKILGLYNNDYRRSLHLREIARETKVDVKAIQLQLKRLEKMDVLSSVFKGRNKEYCPNLSNSITKYYMILAETFSSINYLTRNFLIKKTVNEIRDKIEGAIILFGSFAKGEATEESDVDLFILTDRKLDRNALVEAGSLIGRVISVKSSNKKRFLEGLKSNDPLVREVVSNHILLKGIDDFCDIMWRYYARQ